MPPQPYQHYKNVSKKINQSGQYSLKFWAIHVLVFHVFSHFFHFFTFYQTQVNLGSDLWVRISFSEYVRTRPLLRLNWCDSGWQPSNLVANFAAWKRATGSADRINDGFERLPLSGGFSVTSVVSQKKLFAEHPNL